MGFLKQFQKYVSKDERLARILHGSISGLFARIFTVALNAASLPITLHYLGQTEYGIWVTISTSVAMLSVLDLGIANTLTNFMAEAYAENDRSKAQRYFSTAFWITVAILVAIVPISIYIWHRVNWGTLFNLGDQHLARQTSLCIGAAGLMFFISLPLTLANRVLGGYQQVHIANYFAMANSLFGLIAILVTMLLHGGIVIMMTAYSGGLLVGTVALNLWLCFWHKPWLKPLPHKASLEVVKRLFGQGFLFFVIQLTVLVVFNSDNLVITHYLGPDAVAPYSVGWRLAQMAAVLQGVIMPSLWPALSEAYHKRQMDWINQTYKSLWRKTLTVVVTAALIVGVFGQFIIRIWTKGMAVPGKPLLWLMAIFVCVMATTTNQALLLAATGRLKLEAIVAVLAAAANLALSIYLVKRIGAEGVILSTLLSFVVFMLIPQAWEVKRVLRGKYLPRKS